MSATTQRGDDDDNNNAGGYNNNGGRYGKKKEWTPEGGMERGVRALARARGGEDGEGVREFERLVLGRVESDNGEDGDGRQGAWKEEVQESVRVVERLLRGEM